MPKLSVIIVNYNVKYFLEQCLISVLQASKHIDTEIFVVDNNSADGSPEMVRERFPQIKLIANKDNLGFSKANNQAIVESSGEYILLLNPDTLVEEDTFEKCVSFMDDHPDAGGLGVKMVDGKGRFLPESKRGLPTPEVAFYKIFGLASLFPSSPRFGKYHLGHLSKDEIHEIDVLAGAFMFMRKSVLDKVGLLDETFFMYGEDIDLSWRIKLGGFKNYYFPEARIIHYKGESTKKGSLNYVFVFYRAMIIFARKHFSSSQAGLFSFFINAAVYLRAFLSIIKRFAVRSAAPLADFAVALTGLLLVTRGYESVKGMTYPQHVLSFLLPLYAGITVIAVYLAGGYDKPVRIKNIAKGILIGIPLMLIIYSLLGEDHRFSRAVILLGGIAVFTGIAVLRALYHLVGISGYTLSASGKKRIVVIGMPDEAARIREMLEQIRVQYSVLVEVRPRENIVENTDHYVGKLSVLPEVIKGLNINEVIFCSKDIDAEQIITQMSRLEKYSPEYKIAPPESAFIIGSNSVNSTGEFYSLFELNSISTPANKRNKRLFDILFSLFLLIVGPFIMAFNTSVRTVYPRLFAVIAGMRTWVGYDAEIAQKLILPKIKPAVLSVSDHFKGQNKNTDMKIKAHLNYANKYHWQTDLRYIWKSMFGKG